MIVDFIKGNLVLTIFAVISLAITAVAGWDTISKQSKVNQYTKQVEEVRASARAFTKFKWKLSPKNADIAEANAVMARENFEATLDKIVERYNVKPQSDSGMTSGQVKNLIGRRSRVMENKLRGENIEIPENLKNFTFAPYLASTVFPNSREIAMIMKQLEVMDELVNLLAGSGIAEVTGINREELELTTVDLHSYVELEIDMVGEHPSIVHFLNSLHDSKYFFVLRKIEITEVANCLADLGDQTSDQTNDQTSGRIGGRIGGRMDGRTGDRIGARMNNKRSNKRAGTRKIRDDVGANDSEPDSESALANQLQQHDRIVFMEYPLLQAKLLLAYYEFHDREG